VVENFDISSEKRKEKMSSTSKVSTILKVNYYSFTRFLPSSHGSIFTQLHSASTCRGAIKATVHAQVAYFL
jgi:hypothetical protein